jgi:hypothetical protein
MKNSNKPSPALLKALATHFEEDFKHNLPVVIHNDGNMTYKKFVILKSPHETWGVFESESKSCLGHFFLKTCAIMIAKASHDKNYYKMLEIKQLDTNYWTHYFNKQVYKTNIKKTKSPIRQQILLSKLENSRDKVEFYKSRISNMFKYSFV